MEWFSRNRSQLLIWGISIQRVSWIRLTQLNSRLITQRYQVSQLASLDQLKSSVNGSKSSITFTGRVVTSGLAGKHLSLKSRISSLNMYSSRIWSLFIGKGELIASLISKFLPIVIVEEVFQMVAVHRLFRVPGFRMALTIHIMAVIKRKILSLRMFGSSSA